MKIIIQKSLRGYAVTFIDMEEFEGYSLQAVTKQMGYFADQYFEKIGIRPTITILPIKSNPMAMTKKTYPAKKQAVVAKAKKVVKKVGKK